MKDQRTKPFLLAIFGYFTLGCMVLTAQTAVRWIIEEQAGAGWTLDDGTRLITCMSMANLLMSIVGNMLMEKIGRRGAMVIYSGMIVVSFALFALLPNPMTYYPLMIVAGLAWGGINSLVNTVVTELYHGSASRLNVMHACYAIGAVTFPLLMGFMVSANIGWRMPVWIVTGLGVALMIFSLFTKIPGRVQQTDEHGKSSDVKFWKELGFYLSAITLFVYVGVESGVSTFLAGALAAVNPFFEKVPGETMVSLTWAMLLVGRLVFAGVSTKVDRKVLLVLLSAGFLVGVGGVVLFGASTVPAILFTVILGLSMSAIYATAVANADRYVEGSAVAPGIIFGAGGLGSAVIPLIASGIGHDMHTSMSYLCVFLGILVIATAMNMCDASRHD